MRLLLVEDDARLARSYQRMLERKDYQVDVFHDAETAWALLLRESRNIQGIILDVMLPGQSGIDLCRQIRSAGIDVPVLLLTALDQTADKVTGLDAGADDYLTKPFPFEELLARIRAITRRPQRLENATTEIRVGSLVIDLLLHEVYLDGRLIPLTPREYTLLEFLARNPERALSRRQISARVWPEGTEAGSNVLDTYIHHLREKLDDYGVVQMIQTVRGVGYALRAPQSASSSRTESAT
ncbi:MAG TPA: response regulator transcription factor [Ktedonobacterales bacterium]|nr:response regulator transcription factor [Ktedonobacterales bacterium]